MRSVEDYFSIRIKQRIHVRSRLGIILINMGATRSSNSCACVRRLRLGCSVCYSFIVGLPDGTRVVGCVDLVASYLTGESIVFHGDWGQREVVPNYMSGETQTRRGSYILLSPFSWIV